MGLKITTDNITTTTLNTISGVKISGVTYTGSATAADPAGGETITLTGSGFNSGVTVYVDTTSCTTTYVSSTSCTFTSPAKTVGNYHIYVYNTDGGMGMKPGGYVSSSIPVWVTSSGALQNASSGVAYSQTVSATGDGTITYNVTTGSLPTGLSLNSNTGAITGTSSVIGTSTFTITASDSQNQTASRSFSIAVANVTSSITYLLVAGGGAGGTYGGGGGAGGLITGTQSVTAGTPYTITIGAGGVSVSQSAGVPGNDSTAFGLTAYAGGGGSQNGTSTNGGNGGSGGGGGVPQPGGKGVYPGSTYISATRQGYDGGLGGGGVVGNYHGGGGGGAGGVGTDGGAGPSGVGGDGGLGVQSSITGTALYYAGGGGGSGFSGTQGVGGSGVGGTGNSSTAGQPGAVNTGSGGAGGGYSGGVLLGGTGGSGVLIISYPSTYAVASSTTGSPTVTTSGGNRIYKFTSSGSITF